MDIRRKARWLLLAIAAIVGLAIDLPFIGEAHAIIGRPLTPFSYAGVARRTTRRAVYMGGAAYGGYGGYGYPSPYYW